MTAAALDVRAVTVTHPARRGGRPVTAVDRVDLRIDPGQVLGLVGGSGSGKTTLARTVAGLRTPDHGTVLVAGTDLTRLRGRALRGARRRVQLVHQDPVSSLDPHRTVHATVSEALAVHGVPRADRRRQAAGLLDLVGLAQSTGARRPGELSGGQCQRVAIARALAMEPRVLVCDEPVTALDTTAQARVLDLLADLCTRLGTACLFISHDLAVVAQVADRIAVLHRGRVVDEGPTLGLLADPRWPRHPQTVRLLAAVPRLAVGVAAPPTTEDR